MYVLESVVQGLTVPELEELEVLVAVVAAPLEEEVVGPEVVGPEVVVGPVVAPPDELLDGPAPLPELDALVAAVGPVLWLPDDPDDAAAGPLVPEEAPMPLAAPAVVEPTVPEPQACRAAPAVSKALERSRFRRVNRSRKMTRSRSLASDMGKLSK